MMHGKWGREKLVFICIDNIFMLFKFGWMMSHRFPCTGQEGKLREGARPLKNNPGI